jgi:PAS domain S-box-containing protein
MEKNHNDIENNSKIPKQIYNNVLEQQAILLDNIETQIWYLINELTYGAVNKSYATYIGVEKRDLEGKNIYDVRSKEEAELCVAGNSAVYKEKKQIRTEEWVTNSKGEKRLFSIIKTPKIDDKGNVEYVVCTAQDITEQKQSEEVLRKRARKTEILNRIIIAGNEANNLQTLLETILKSTLELMNFEGGGIYLVNGTTEYAELAYHEGLPLDFIENVRRVKINEMYYKKIFIDGLPIYTNDYHKINPERSKKWGFLSLASVPIISKGKVIGALNIASKSRYSFTLEETELFSFACREIGNVISKLKAEEALRESEKNYRRSYNRAEFYKDLFAHDMNNILQNLKSSAELLRLWLNDPEKGEKIRDLINILKEQIDRGASLITNVRKLSAIEDEGVDEKIIELNHLLTTTITQIKNRFLERQVKIKFDPASEFSNVKAGDLLVDVFENILINAIMHNKSDIIQLEVKISEVQEYNKKYFKIEFLDNGIGILDDVKEVIFNRAYKKEKATSGMGIGLSLVKKIITSYGGKIWIENRVKGDYTKGSNFIVLLKKN